MIISGIVLSDHISNKASTVRHLNEISIEWEIILIFLLYSKINVFLIHQTNWNNKQTDIELNTK
jgi:hypothetical protein